MIRVSIDCLGLESPSIKEHPDRTGAPKKRPASDSLPGSRNAVSMRGGKYRGGWNTKVHLIAANDKFALTFSLSGGNAKDAPEGRALLES